MPQTLMGEWKGQWCWTQKHLSRPWNSYAYFRRTVDLPGKPQRAIVRVSADARYTLYVNGRRVHFGPARSFPEYQSYDTLDLAAVLAAGKNVICAIVHQFGVPTFQSVYRGASGFILDGTVEVDGQPIALHTPDGWMCREAKAWRKDTSRLSIQLGFQEHFDAAADPAEWMSHDAVIDESQGWRKPFVHGPAGSPPWLSMEARGVPLLADHVEAFAGVTAQFRGENAPGYADAADVYQLAVPETRRKEKAILDNPQAMLRDDGDMTTVPATAPGSFVMAVLDLGRERVGHVAIDIADAAGGEIIDILYTEDVDKSGAAALLGQPSPDGCEVAMADRYRCRAGAQRWEPFFFKGMRYATLIFRNVSRPLKIRQVALRQVQAAAEEIGSFECSDPRLNEIWRTGRDTLRNCMLDAYVDCPWREQAQWWGDARVQFRVNAYSLGDISLFERGIRQVAQSQAADGSMHAHPPADVPRHRLPDYMLTWVGSLWDHYFHTGRTELLRECLSAMHRLFAFFEAHEVRDGLIGDFQGYWVFLDWADLYRDNFSAMLNLMYLQALRWAAAICLVLEEADAAARYDTKATALEAAVEKYFFDAKAKVWRDGFDPKANAPVESVSQHVNALAILLDLNPETHPAIARDVLLKSANSRRGKVLTASPFFYAYVLDALFEAGFRMEAMDVIREKWGKMIDAGATSFWELWDVTVQSRCHAWSAAPVYHISQQALGVMPVDVGWTQVRIAPLPGKLEFARGQVPSPLGAIRVEWEKAGEDQLAVRADVPQGMKAEFVSPLGEIRPLGPGGHEFHT